jgi:hypothetical protein
MCEVQAVHIGELETRLEIVLAEKVASEQIEEEREDWNCDYCGHSNGGGQTKCMWCWNDNFWVCGYCSFSNKLDWKNAGSATCEACTSNDRVVR